MTTKTTTKAKTTTKSTATKIHTKIKGSAKNWTEIADEIKAYKSRGESIDSLASDLGAKMKAEGTERQELAHWVKACHAAGLTKTECRDYDRKAKKNVGFIATLIEASGHEDYSRPLYARHFEAVGYPKDETKNKGCKSGKKGAKPKAKTGKDKPKSKDEPTPATEPLIESMIRNLENLNQTDLQRLITAATGRLSIRKAS